MYNVDGGMRNINKKKQQEVEDREITTCLSDTRQVILVIANKFREEMSIT